MVGECVCVCIYAFLRNININYSLIEIHKAA